MNDDLVHAAPLAQGADRKVVEGAAIKQQVTGMGQASHLVLVGANDDNGSARVMFFWLVPLFISMPQQGFY